MDDSSRTGGAVDRRGQRWHTDESDAAQATPEFERSGGRGQSTTARHRRSFKAMRQIGTLSRWSSFTETLLGEERAIVRSHGARRIFVALQLMSCQYSIRVWRSIRLDVQTHRQEETKGKIP
jgi:hypothetical protein